MAIDTTGAHRRARQLLQSATKGHGVFMARVGQAWAFPSLLAFSVGAFIKLGGDGLLPEDIATIARISATIVLLISGVLALEIALFSIGDAIARRRFTWRMAWDIALVFVVAPLETWTLYLLITGQPANGPVDLMRAAEAVMATAYLATLIIQPPSDREFVRLIGSRAGELTATKLELIPLDDVGMGRLYRVQAVANDESLSWSERADKLVGVMEELAPGEQERAHQRRIAALEQRAMEAERAATDAVTAAKERAIEMTSRALTSLLAGGMLPDWLTEARPELADITLTKRPVSRGKAAGIPTAKAPQSRTDAMRFFLHSLDITPAKAPDKMRGIWLKSSDIPALIGEHRLPESPTKLAERLGKAATKGETAPRDGTAYIARLEDVMPALIAYHCVDDSVLEAWANVPQSNADTGDNGAVIPFDSRRQAQG